MGKAKTNQYNTGNPTYHCKACEFELGFGGYEQYVFCSSCGSANYISERSAEEENREYFNREMESKPIEKRKELFHYFERIYLLLKREEIKVFNTINGLIDSTIQYAAQCAEIGFGSGHELVNWLRKGVNIYGFDLSEKMVAGFKKNHPEYQDRVFNISAHQFNIKVDAVFSNALFEHLDNPGDFLKQAYRLLNSKGKLILKLPLITHPNQRKAQYDINFWKPCHRVLYTEKGLKNVLQKHGFKIIQSASLRSYVHRVMYRMLELGYTEIMHVRNPYYEIKNLDSDKQFKHILMRSLLISPVCSDFALIAGKMEEL